MIGRIGDGKSGRSSILLKTKSKQREPSQTGMGWNEEIRDRQRPDGLRRITLPEPLLLLWRR
jgi:hypothetical protein